MTSMTITEALAEIKTVEKRIVSKRNFVTQYLFRPDSLRDPLEKDGGSETIIAQENQAIGDLQERIVALRTAIQKANDTNSITLEGNTKTIAEWLVWRREVAPGMQLFYQQLKSKLDSARNQLRNANSTYARIVQQEQEKPLDIVVNINEAELNKKAEILNNILGQLDGQLSLKNATVMVELD